MEKIRDNACLLSLGLDQGAATLQSGPSLCRLQGCSPFSLLWSGSTIGVELLRTGRLNRARGGQAGRKANLISVG